MDALRRNRSLSLRRPRAAVIAAALLAAALPVASFAQVAPGRPGSSGTAGPAAPSPQRAPAGAAADPGLKDENLLQSVPEGYTIANRQSSGQAVLMEMIPQGQTLENWTDMVTTQIYLGARNASFEAYQADMLKRWKGACSRAEAIPVTDGKENGYAFRLWLQTCRHDDPARKPEITWFKMILGNDSAYVVQKAFRFEPEKEQITRWIRYLRGVTVCDSRLKDRPCRLGS